MYAHNAIVERDVEIIPIYASPYSALVIKRGGEVVHTVLSSMYKDTWNEKGYTLTQSPTHRGEYDLVLKVGGEINIYEALDKFGYSFADVHHTVVRKMR